MTPEQIEQIVAYAHRARRTPDADPAPVLASVLGSEIPPDLVVPTLTAILLQAVGDQREIIADLMDEEHAPRSLGIEVGLHDVDDEECAVRATISRNRANLSLAISYTHEALRGRGTLLIGHGGLAVGSSAQPGLNLDGSSPIVWLWGMDRLRDLRPVTFTCPSPANARRQQRRIVALLSSLNIIWRDLRRAASSADAASNLARAAGEAPEAVSGVPLASPGGGFCSGMIAPNWAALALPMMISSEMGTPDNVVSYVAGSGRPTEVGSGMGACPLPSVEEHSLNVGNPDDALMLESWVLGEGPSAGHWGIEMSWRINSLIHANTGIPRTHRGAAGVEIARLGSVALAIGHATGAVVVGSGTTTLYLPPVPPDEISQHFGMRVYMRREQRQPFMEMLAGIVRTINASAHEMMAISGTRRRNPSRRPMQGAIRMAAPAPSLLLPRTRTRSAGTASTPAPAPGGDADSDGGGAGAGSTDIWQDAISTPFYSADVDRAVERAMQEIDRFSLLHAPRPRAQIEPPPPSSMVPSVSDLVVSQEVRTVMGRALQRVRRAACEPMVNVYESLRLIVQESSMNLSEIGNWSISREIEGGGDAMRLSSFGIDLRIAGRPITLVRVDSIAPELLQAGQIMARIPSVGARPIHMVAPTRGEWETMESSVDSDSLLIPPGLWLGGILPTLLPPDAVRDLLIDINARYQRWESPLASAALAGSEADRYVDFLAPRWARLRYRNERHLLALDLASRFSPHPSRWSIVVNRASASMLRTTAHGARSAHLAIFSAPSNERIGAPLRVLIRRPYGEHGTEIRFEHLPAEDSLTIILPSASALRGGRPYGHTARIPERATDRHSGYQIAMGLQGALDAIVRSGAQPGIIRRGWLGD